MAYRVPTVVRRSALLVPVGAATTALARAVWEVPAAFGARPAGERLERMRRSPRFRDGVFHNETQARVAPAGDTPSIVRELVFGKERRRPRKPVPLMVPELDSPPADGLRVTWMGHATALVELEGRRVLIDPVWSERVSPSQAVGPRRMHPMPLAIEALPAVDAVVISHDHYDHLDMRTIRKLAAVHQMPFLVPLGVGAHLERWGIAQERIIELDWEESATVAGLTFTATASRHFSGRRRPGENTTLWVSWVLAGKDRRIFYTGDSGYFDDYAKIGAAHGPFDATLVQIGAYSPYWPDIHMTPEEGTATHLAVRGGLLIPVHWGTFNLALHSWSEPVERVLKDADRHDIRVAVPRPGQVLDVDKLPKSDPWWRAIA